MSVSSSHHIDIPELTSVSINRDEIMEILNPTFDSSFAVPPQVLVGAPGIGKSYLALQYACNSKQAGRYMAIRWMRMDPANILHEWIKFAYDLNIESTDLPLVDIVRLVFRQLRQYRYLLIYDGVDGYDSILPYLPIDAQAGQHVLITSRSEVDWSGEVVVIHRLDPFTPTQSIAFVRNFCEVNDIGTVFDEIQALALHDIMEGLPQCLFISMQCIAARNTSTHHLSITQFINNCKQVQRESHAGVKVGVKFQSMLFLYQVCIQQLHQHENAAASRRLLAQLSLLGNSDCVSITLLKVLTGLEATVDSVLLPLMHHALLLQRNVHTFQCPSSVQAAVCALQLKLDMWTPDISRLPAFDEAMVINEILQPLVNAFCTILLTESDAVSTVAERKLLHALACDSRAQCEHVLGIVQQFLAGDGISTARRHSLQKMKCALLICIASAMCRQQQYKRALASLSSIKTELSVCLAAEDVMYGRFHYVTGLCFVKMGDRNTSDCVKSKSFLNDALKSFTTCLQIYTAVFGDSHADVAACLSQIGLVNCILGNYTEARECYEQVMIIQHVLYQDDMHPKFAQTLHDTAAVSLASGDTTEAVLLYRESLAMKKRLYGTTHVEIALTIHQIGVIYEKELKIADACSQFDLALAMKRKVYGEVHEAVATELACIGAIYKKMGKYADALSSVQSSLLIQRKIYDDKHIEIARTLHFIGTIYQDQGKYALALQYFEESVNMKVVISADSDEELLHTWLCIAAVYLSQGKYVESHKTFEQCLDIQRELYPARHPMLVRTLLGIAGVCENQGKYGQSLSNYEEALSIQREHFGHNYLTAASTLVKVAWVQRQQEKYAESLRTYNEALDILKGHHGEFHGEVASVLTSIGNLYNCQGRYDDALVYLNHALTIKKTVYPEGHQSIIQSEELVDRIQRQRDFTYKVLASFQDYVTSRREESFVVSTSLRLSFSKDDKIAAAEFIVRHLEEKGLERISGLKSTAEYKKHEGPLNDGRLGQLVKKMYEEFYSSRDGPSESPTRARRGTI